MSHMFVSISNVYENLQYCKTIISSTAIYQSTDQMKVFRRLFCDFLS